MHIILDELKMRLAAAQKRQLEAAQRLQIAQAESTAANNEVNVWTHAVNIETREEAARVAEASKDQISIDLPRESIEADAADHVEPEHEEADPVSKTEKVRTLLRQNPNGMTPANIWTAFHQLAPKASRNYLYSILKRLRDKDEVVQRRGKYLLKIKPLDTHQEASEGKGTIVM